MSSLAQGSRILPRDKQNARILFTAWGGAAKEKEKRIGEEYSREQRYIS